MTTTETAWRILAGVPDPEIPVISVIDLGIIRRVEVDDDHVIVDVSAARFERIQSRSKWVDFA